MNKLIFISSFLIISIISINQEYIGFNDIKNRIISEEEDEEDIYLNGEYENELILNTTNNKKYIFHLTNSEYIYFFESGDINGYIHYEDDFPCPNLCAIQFNQSIHENKLYINYYKNATDQNILIKISSVKNFEGEIISIKSNDFIINSIQPVNILKSIFIFESFNDYIFYIKSIDKSIAIKYSEYNEEMTKLDILNTNPKYFKNRNNQIGALKPNSVYIFSIISKDYNKPLEVLLQPKLQNDNIKIIDDQTNYIYLSSEKDKYTLDFTQNTLIRSIKLSRLAIDAEIIITEKNTNEDKKLNKDNLYYIFNDENTPFQGVLELKVSNSSDALIEFLFKYDAQDTEILDEKEYTNYRITKEKTIIKFNNNDKNKFINLNIFSENYKNFKFSMISGYAKGNYFKYSPTNQLSYLNYEMVSTEIMLYNENITLENDEYFYLFLNFEKEKILDETYSISLTKIDKYTLDDINLDVPDEKTSNVIESLIKLFEDAYIYTDIKKSPPNPEYFGKLDIISEINNIQKYDRKYYDLYRDIKGILGKIKDGHLNIAAYTSPNGYNIGLMSMCLPFSFYIDGKDRNDAKMYIKKFDPCFEFFTKEEQDFVNDYEGKYLKEINNTNPFDFIQNIQSEFNSFYNQHSSFTYSLSVAHQMSISSNPLSKSQFSNITFIFEDDNSITLDYYLNNKNPKLSNNKEFMEFYNKEILKLKKSLEIKPILELEKEFNKMKENINQNDTIEWDYSTLDGDGIQCRVDENNKVNVFKQKTFYFLGEEYKQALEVVENCTEAFYNNSYPIVGIESRNGGGVCKLSYYFQELLQVKILPTPHYSVKLSELMKNYVEADIDVINTDPDMYQRIDIETCKPFKKFNDMKEIKDDYGNNVTHSRSQYFRVYNSSDLKKHRKRREKYFEMDKLKKPTEILIFTDSFSFSATSFFIKGLQETGSAILVGYQGNPKNDAPFDASQSPSFVGDLSNSDVYAKLLDAGYLIHGVTIYESYNYTYKEKNPTPREYLVHPVDEKINMFQPYNDSFYDFFISEAKRIFKEYNEEQKCNPNNLDLLYDPGNKNECYVFENDSYAHGGYECDPETKKWSTRCKPYYCDIGYYFDKVQNKCFKDLCTEVDDDDDDDDKIKLIWIIIIGAAALIIIIIIIILIISKCKSKQRESTASEDNGLLLSNRTTENN